MKTSINIPNIKKEKIKSNEKITDINNQTIDTNRNNQNNSYTHSKINKRKKVQSQKYNKDNNKH